MSRRISKTSLIALIVLTCSFLLSGCSWSSGEQSEKNILNSDYSLGYEWAEDNNIDNFDDCQNEFGTSDEEDGCNEYVKDYYTGDKTFRGYDCTEDCSGHEAGYEWAEEKGIMNLSDCTGNSNSFIEGCKSYVESKY